MRTWCLLLPILLGVSTGGCATITEGGGQVISVNTMPSGATCTFDRNGQRIGVIASTPGALAVDKSRRTILVSCEKPGYQTVMGSDASHPDGAIFGNLLVGGLIGFVVDLITAADYNYGANITVTFPQPTQPMALSRQGFPRT